MSHVFAHTVPKNCLGISILSGSLEMQQTCLYTEATNQLKTCPLECKLCGGRSVAPNPIVTQSRVHWGHMATTGGMREHRLCARHVVVLTVSAGGGGGYAFAPGLPCQLDAKPCSPPHQRSQHFSQQQWPSHLLLVCPHKNVQHYEPSCMFFNLTASMFHLMVN